MLSPHTLQPIEPRPLQQQDSQAGALYYDQPAFTIDQPLHVPDYGASMPPSFDSTPASDLLSRRNSTAFHSSLPYALVRDFAYPPFNPLHYGPVDYSTSGFSTPTADYDPARRLSDPQESHDPAVGPWGDSSYDQSAQPQQLPSTSFSHIDDSEEDSTKLTRRFSKHRKSRSYATLDDYARGRQRTSGDGFKRTSRTPDMWKRGSSLQRELVPSDFLQPQALPERSLVPPYQHPPFREDTDSVPYSPRDQQDHRRESASLDESFAGPSLALYDFSPEHDNELALREGQIIQVGYRHGLGWLVAMDPDTGEQGLVPEEYVRLLRDIDGWGEDGEPDDGHDKAVDPTTSHVSPTYDDEVTLHQQSNTRPTETREPERGKADTIAALSDADADAVADAGPSLATSAS